MLSAAKPNTTEELLYFQIAPYLHSYIEEQALPLNPFSAGIDFRRQNLTYIDVRFWRLNSKIVIVAVGL